MKHYFMKIALCWITVLVLAFSFVACGKDAVATNATPEVIGEAEYDKIVELLPTKTWVASGKYSSSKQLYFVEPEYSYGWYYELNSSGVIDNTKYFTYEIQKSPFRLTATDEEGYTFVVRAQSSSLTSDDIVLSCQSLNNADYATGTYSSKDFTHKYGPMFEYNLKEGKIEDILWVYHPEKNSYGKGKLCLYGSGKMKEGFDTAYGHTPWSVSLNSDTIEISYVSLDPRIESIANNAFKDFKVARFRIEDGTDHLESIGDYAFYGNKMGSFITTLPKTLHVVGNYAFYSETELEKGASLSLPDDLEIIGDYAFYNNIMNSAKSKTEGKNYSLNLPDNCKEVGTHAFKGLVNKIVIYKEINRLSEGAFVMTGEGGDVHFRHKAMDLTGPIIINEKGDNVQSKWTLHVPKGTLDYYTSTSPWNTFGNIVDDESSIYK